MYFVFVDCILGDVGAQEWPAEGTFRAGSCLKCLSLLSIASFCPHARGFSLVALSVPPHSVAKRLSGALEGAQGLPDVLFLWCGKHLASHSCALCHRKPPCSERTAQILWEKLRPEELGLCKTGLNLTHHPQPLLERLGKRMRPKIIDIQGLSLVCCCFNIKKYGPTSIHKRKQLWLC